MTDLIRSSAREAEILLLNQVTRTELSSKRVHLVLQLTLLFGGLVVFGTIFASLEAMEICSASLKANFCP